MGAFTRDLVDAAVVPLRDELTALYQKYVVLNNHAAALTKAASADTNNIKSLHAKYKALASKNRETQAATSKHSAELDELTKQVSALTRQASTSVQDALEARATWDNALGPSPCPGTHPGRYLPSPPPCSHFRFRRVWSVTQSAQQHRH